MLLRRKVYIVIISLLGFLSQSLAYAYMDGAMATGNHAMTMGEHPSASEALNSHSDIKARMSVATGMSEHCKEMADMPQEIDSGTNHSADVDECCMQTCLCASGVCSTSLMTNALPALSLIPSHHGHFLDRNAQVVRVAVSLYRPPITV